MAMKNLSFTSMYENYNNEINWRNVCAPRSRSNNKSKRKQINIKNYWCDRCTNINICRRARFFFVFALVVSLRFLIEQAKMFFFCFLSYFPLLLLLRRIYFPIYLLLLLLMYFIYSHSQKHKKQQINNRFTIFVDISSYFCPLLFTVAQTII